MNRLIWYECKKLLKQNIIVVAIGCLFLLPFFFTRMIPNDSLVKEHFQAFRGELNDAWYEKAAAKLAQTEDFSSDIQYLFSFQFASMQENPDALSKEHLAQLQTKWAQDTWMYDDVRGYESMILGVGGSGYLIMLIFILCFHDLFFKEHPYLETLAPTIQYQKMREAKIWTSILFPLVLVLLFLVVWFAISWLRFGFGDPRSDLRITGLVFTPLHAFQGIWEHCITYLVGGIMISLVCTTLSQIVKSHMSALCIAIFAFYFTGMLPLSYPMLLPYYYLQNYASLRYSGYLELGGHLWESTHLNLLIASSIIVLLSIGFLLYFHPLWKHQRFRSSKQ